MLNRLALTSAIALTLAVPALAQTAVTSPTAQISPATTSNATQIDGNKLIGQSVLNAGDNKTIGTIDSVIIDKTGKIHNVVIGVGGFLGIDKKDVAVDWSQLHVTDNGSKVTMNADKNQLKAMPDYVWPKEHARGSVWTTSDSSRAEPAITNSGSSGISSTPDAGKSSTSPTTR